MPVNLEKTGGFPDIIKGLREEIEGQKQINSGLQQVIQGQQNVIRGYNVEIDRMMTKVKSLEKEMIDLIEEIQKEKENQK